MLCGRTGGIRSGRTEGGIRSSSGPDAKKGSRRAPVPLVFMGGLLLGVVLCVALLAGGWFGWQYVRNRRFALAAQQHQRLFGPQVYA